MVGKKSQQGGALIGKGSYGCVYYPALQCKHQKQYTAQFPRSVMKLTDAPGINEIEISASLRHIDPNGDYFLPLQCETCEIDQSDILVKECDLYQKSSEYNRKKFKGYFSPYGGLSLQDILDEKKPLSLDTIWGWLSYLIGSLSIVHSAKITHNDVTLKNIVIGSDNLPRLIDFGISYYHDDMIITDFYQRHPLFISALNTDKIDKLYNHYSHLPGFYNPAYIKGSENDIILSYFNQAKKSKLNYIKQVIEPNYDKVDLFMLFDLFTDYLNPSQYRNQDVELANHMISLINNNLNPDVTKQFTMAQNLAEVKKINDFLALRKMTREPQIHHLVTSRSRPKETQTPKPKSQMIKLLPAGIRTPKL